VIAPAAETLKAPVVIAPVLSTLKAPNLKLVGVSTAVLFEFFNPLASIVHPPKVPLLAVNTPAFVTPKAVLPLESLIVISPPVIFKLLNSALPSALIAQ
jgi:hypothetical protein